MTTYRLFHVPSTIAHSTIGNVYLKVGWCNGVTLPTCDPMKALLQRLVLLHGSNNLFAHKGESSTSAMRTCGVGMFHSVAGTPLKLWQRCICRSSILLCVAHTRIQYTCLYCIVVSDWLRRSANNGQDGNQQNMRHCHDLVVRHKPLT